MYIPDKFLNRISGIPKIMNKSKVWKRRRKKKTNKIIKVFWLVLVRWQNLREVVIRHQVWRQLDQQMVDNKSHNWLKGHWLRIKKRFLLKQKINKINMKLFLQNLRNQNNLNHKKKKNKIKLKMIKFQRNLVNHRNQRLQKNQKKIKIQLRGKRKRKKFKRLQLHLKHHSQKKRNQ